MNVRIRRLEADWAAVREALEGHPRIRVAGTAGNPPQRYHLLYTVKGLEEKPDGSIVEKNEHLVEISLLRSYPRQAPACRMLTPAFHPNIAPHAICIGDHWSAGESLVQLIFRIGELIAFQSYNVKSPLNGVAAQWVEENVARLPIDPAPLTVGEPAGKEPAAPAGVPCARCGRSSRPPEAWTCPNGHAVCPRCRTVCMGCGSFLCNVCGPRLCGICAQSYCTRCVGPCTCCGQIACAEHREFCQRCRSEVCGQCVTTCAICNQRVCRRHLTRCTLCGMPVCSDHVAACHVCGQPGCPACSTDCQVCGKRACRDHARACFQCNRVVCASDYNPQTGRCSVCEPGAHPATAPTHTPAAAPGPAGAAAEQADTPVVFLCPSCRTKLSAKSRHAGMTVVCPKCRTACTVPGPRRESPR